MNTNCQLCGTYSQKVICSECQRNMEIGYHAIICIVCRTLLGVKHGLTWIERATLGEDVKKAIDDMHKAHGVLAFVRASCPTCQRSEETP